MDDIQALAQFYSDDKMSSAERQWFNDGFLHLRVHLELPGEVFIASMTYEPITFTLPGGKYTPDFMVILSDGRILFIEVKATKMQPSHRDSRSKLRAAAAVYPFFTFIYAIQDREAGWLLSTIKPDGIKWTT